MKTYFLVFCFPAVIGFSRGSGNQTIAECVSESKQAAIEKLQEFCSVKLDNDGYAKDGEFTYVIGESFS